ncbi:MAG: hypothetical protein AVO39_03950 [delta proteobacterium MLS_D]|jgi:branched-chain amino acid transport system substrate-binding protein|nr:MAG: hypothetical protein AVO39_03950 [delta proteobacterium MLS_D]
MLSLTGASRAGVRWFILLLLAVLVVSCARVPVKRPDILSGPSAVPMPEKLIPSAYRPALDEAEKALAEGDYLRGLRLYEAVLEKEPPAVVSSWGRFRAGQILVALDRPREAAPYFEYVVEHIRGEAFEEEAVASLVRLYRRMDVPERINTLAKDLRYRNVPAAFLVRLFQAAAAGAENDEKWEEAVELYVEMLGERPEDEAQIAEVRVRVEDIIKNKLDPDELERLLLLFGRDYPAGYILYRLARLCDEKGDYAAAERYIKTFMGQYEDHPLMEDARSLSRSLAERLEAEIRTVGCILPLSGRFASYGNRMLDAIVLASGVFDVSRETRVRLAVRDSKSDPAEARRAVEDLVFDENAVALLGPLESRSAFEAAERAHHLRTPIMTLTQAQGVTELGDYVFRNFITADGQVEALVDYAVNRLGVRRFAVLYPDDAYGREMMFRFWYAVATRGGAVEGMEPYEQDQTDFSKEIKRLVNLEVGKDKTDIPVVNFDAIFIPDSALKARLIAPQLDFHDVIGVRMLGTNEWNVPDLLEGETDYLEGAVFVDVFFKDSNAPEVTDYLDKFYGAFGREADGIEALAYDAASILIEGIINGGARTPSDLRDWLSDLRNYSGVTGMTSFPGNGDAEKQLSILSVQDGRIVQLE